MSQFQPADPEKGHLEANHTDAEKQYDANGEVPTAPDLDYNAEKASSEDEPQPEAPLQMKNPMMDPSSFPDGGLKAWMTVGGAWCALFVSFGRTPLASTVLGRD